VKETGERLRMKKIREIGRMKKRIKDGEIERKMIERRVKFRWESDCKDGERTSLISNTSISLRVSPALRRATGMA
jgi:hypothetical protein